MEKIRKSITINDNVNSEIEKQAELEGRSYSNMIEQMAKKYLDDLKEKVV
jgi:predicted CopG family antitoxin